MLISEIYSSINFYISEVLFSDLSVSIIYANQIASRPKKPFITIDIRNFKHIDFATRFDISEDGIQDVLLHKSFTLSLNSYADNLHQAESILNKIHNSFFSENAYLFFKGKLSYVRTLIGVSAIPKVENSQTESRAILEMEFYVNQEFLDAVGLIEHVVITDEITSNEIIINK